MIGHAVSSAAAPRESQLHRLVILNERCFEALGECRAEVLSEVLREVLRKD